MAKDRAQLHAAFDASRGETSGSATKGLATFDAVYMEKLLLSCSLGGIRVNSTAINYTALLNVIVSSKKERQTKF